MRFFRLALPLAMIASIIFAGPASGQATVQRIDLELVIDGPLPHAVIRERLRATVLVVIERLLAGRPLEQLTPLQPRLGETIASVVDRVALGFTVTSAAVQLGVSSHVAVRLQPSGPIMRDVELATDLRVVHPRVHPIIADVLQQAAAPEIRAFYAGLPQAAMAWAEPILEAQSREVIERALPGFTGSIRTRVRGESAVAEVVLLPKDTRVIRNIGVRFRSSSIPTMLLDQHGPAIASMAEPLRGLPVAFAQAHREDIQALIKAELAAYPPARQYRIIATPSLDAGETTFVTVLADSVLFRGRVEAQLNIGMQAPGPAVIGHLGRLVTPSTETFIEVRVAPTPLSLDWSLGVQVAVSPSASIGGAYALVSRESTAWVALRTGLDTAVRATWNLNTHVIEGAFAYRFNEFLTGEMIATSRGVWWLRLVSNL